MQLSDFVNMALAWTHTDGYVLFPYVYLYMYYVDLSLYMYIYLAVLKDEKNILLTRTKKSLAEKTAALHGFINLILACSTEKHAYDGFCWDSATVSYGKMSTTCQHFTRLVRFTVFYVGSKSSMKPTKCQQTPNKCQHFVNIGGWHLFLREEPSISSWLPENLSASKARQKQLKNQNTAFYLINLDFSNRTFKKNR